MGTPAEADRDSASRAQAGEAIWAAGPFGMVLVALPALAIGTASLVGAIVAALLVLGVRHRPWWAVATGLILGGAAGWGIGFVSANLTPYAADSMLTGFLLLGCGLGIASGVSARWRAGMPTWQTMRGEFLEFCALAGLFAGFVFLRGNGLIGAAEFAGRMTFGAALIGMTVLGPWMILGNGIGRLLKMRGT